MSAPTRRQFLKTVALSSAVTMSAASYARVAGANDRISIGMIGCGDRGRGAHMTGVQQHAEKENVEITAVCDPHRLAREEAAGLCKEWFGRDARQFTTYRDLLALEDVDAVMIASCDHLHTLHLRAAVEAGKDVYVEKPLSMDMATLNTAYDAVKASGAVVQVGTQLRSMGSFTGAQALCQSGALGTIARIEQCRNSHRPYWYNYIKEIREEDVDWKEFLHDRAWRPFNAVTYSGWYGYRDFSDGPVPGLGSHFIDLVHYITGAKFPTSSVCLGGTYTWHDDHNFSCPDHVQALWEYPEGFLVSYSTNFGNGSGNSFKVFGNGGMMDLTDWNSPTWSKAGLGESGGAKLEPEEVQHINRPDHVQNWLQCLRSRETPHASIDAGYQHAVAVIMAMQSYDSGRKVMFDQAARELRTA